jgi:hypothetical protein
MIIIIIIICSINRDQNQIITDNSISNRGKTFFLLNEHRLMFAHLTSFLGCLFFNF